LNHALLIGEAGERAFERVGDPSEWTAAVLSDLGAAREVLLSGISGAAMVIADVSRLSVRELLATASDVAEHAPDLALGYVCGRDAVQLSGRAARVRAGDPGPRSTTPIRLFNQLFQRHPLRGANLLDGREVATSAEEAIAMLRDPSELDFFIGHSNGIDMSVGGVVLCRHDGLREALPPDHRTMPCFHGGECTRRLGGAGMRTPVDGIGARRVVNASCWGAVPDAAAFASEFSLAEGLLHGANLDVLLACLRVVSFETPELSLMYYLCNSGIPLGLVANRANQLRRLACQEAEWICFGDPRQVLPCASEAISPLRTGSDGVVEISIPEARARARDLRVSLSGLRMPEQPVAIALSPDGVVSSALDPRGELHLTVAANWRGVLRLLVLDRRAMTAATRGAAQLLAWLGFLDAYAHGPLQARQPERVAAVIRAAGEVRCMLLSWPLDELPVASVIGSDVLARLWAVLDRQLAKFCELAVELAIESMRVTGCMQFDWWVWAYQMVSAKRIDGGCVYCGHDLHEWILRARLQDATRRMGLCDGCGCVYDGEPELVRWLQIEAGARAGHELVLRLLVSNPLPVTLPVVAAVVFDLHEKQLSVTSPAAHRSVRPAERIELVLRLPIPDVVYSGTYYVGAAVAVGSRINFLQRPVPVAGRHLPVVTNTVG